MSTDTTPAGDGTRPAEDPLPRDAAYWAAPVSQLVAASEAARARGLDGKRLMGPQQGFGKLWRRSHRIPLTGVAMTPEAVVAQWKVRFGEFWPRGGRFHPSLGGIEPGEVAALDVGVGQVCVLSTGVFVIYADETSFAYMTPEGHALAAWITFSAEEDRGTTVADISMLLRTADPLVELPYVLGGARLEDRFWQATLRNLATAFGAEGPPPVETSVVCLDRRRQWAQARNVRHFGGVRTALRGFRAPRGG
ncbi:hypothetical protein [Geodermatophilus sp. SYSU D00766]